MTTLASSRYIVARIGVAVAVLLTTIAGCTSGSGQPPISPAAATTRPSPAAPTSPSLHLPYAADMGINLEFDSAAVPIPVGAGRRWNTSLLNSAAGFAGKVLRTALTTTAPMGPLPRRISEYEPIHTYMSDAAWDDFATAVAAGDDPTVSSPVPSSFSDEDTLIWQGAVLMDANEFALPYTFAGAPTMTIATAKDGTLLLMVTFPLIRAFDGTRDGKPVHVEFARDQSLYLGVDGDHWVVAGWHSAEKIVSGRAEGSAGLAA